jgi:uncharacterized membrane protein HdeD (DUF308 family)
MAHLKTATAKYWYVPLFIGILLVLFGIYILNIPHTAYLVMITFFSISIIVTGLSELFFYVRNKVENRGIHIAGAILVLATGIYLLTRPADSAFVIALIVAFQLLIRSVQVLIFSFSMKDAHVPNWYLLAITSLIGSGLAIVLAAQPMIVGLSLVILTGMCFIFAGMIGIALSIVVKKLQGTIDDLVKQAQNRGGNIKDGEYEIVED